MDSLLSQIIDIAYDAGYLAASYAAFLAVCTVFHRLGLFDD